MNSFRSEPFLWIHLAGLALVPPSLLVVWLGLAAGDPSLPVVLEIGFLAIAGILPIAWMQWQQPFDIFSLLVLAIRPDRLTLEQRKILRLLKTFKIRLAATAMALFMLWAIWQIYRIAPLAAIATPLSPRWHLLGLLSAAIAFFFSNLFLQVPTSVLSVLLTSDARFAEIEPYEIENIRRDFFVFGIRIQNPFALASPLTSTDSPIQTQPNNPPVEKIDPREETATDALESEEEQADFPTAGDNKQIADSLESEENQQDDNIQNNEIVPSEPLESPTSEAEKTEENIAREKKITSENGEDSSTDKESSSHS
ncbi:MAG: low-complexity tail membrane protein [Cyanobacteria bacterium SBLK]|nr:low-complexity tail membrane protein [Cyanobacteria bacterium SBLK]